MSNSTIKRTREATTEQINKPGGNPRYVAAGYTVFDGEREVGTIYKSGSFGWRVCWVTPEGKNQGRPFDTLAQAKAFALRTL